MAKFARINPIKPCLPVFCAAAGDGCEDEDRNLTDVFPPLDLLPLLGV